MKIIPSINCPDFDCVQSRLVLIREMLQNESEPWVHIDVADGGFTKGYSTWRNPADLKDRLKGLKAEIHLMVHEPETLIESWRIPGVQRIIFHLETARNVEEIVLSCRTAHLEPMLALKYDTPVAHALSYLAGVEKCQLLAVAPGHSGQSFEAVVLEKCKEIKEHYPKMEIEVDGGINHQTAFQCKKAGIDQAVATSFLFNAPDPLKAYHELVDL